MDVKHIKFLQAIPDYRVNRKLLVEVVYRDVREYKVY